MGKYGEVWKYRVMGNYGGVWKYRVMGNYEGGITPSRKRLMN